MSNLRGPDQRAVSRVAGKQRFHDEKDAFLLAGLTHSSAVAVNDTGTRHQGENGYVTQIGNEAFAWFASTESKSRINFLQLLRAAHTGYRGVRLAQDL